MALTLNYGSLIIDSDSSIVDLPAFHAELRDAEDSATGMLYPVTHRWNALDLGGGGFFYQADLLNGWALRFPTPGNYVISGNLKGSIVPVAGVYVERETSAAYITTSVGGGGGGGATAAEVWAYGTRTITPQPPSADDIAAAIVAALGGTAIPVNVKKVNDVTIKGAGVLGNLWGPA